MTLRTIPHWEEHLSRHYPHPYWFDLNSGERTWTKPLEEITKDIRSNLVALESGERRTASDFFGHMLLENGTQLAITISEHALMMGTNSDSTAKYCSGLIGQQLRVFQSRRSRTWRVCFLQPRAMPDVFGLFDPPRIPRLFDSWHEPSSQCRPLQPSLSQVHETQAFSTFANMMMETIDATSINIIASALAIVRSDELLTESAHIFVEKAISDHRSAPAIAQICSVQHQRFGRSIFRKALLSKCQHRWAELIERMDDDKPAQIDEPFSAMSVDDGEKKAVDISGRRSRAAELFDVRVQAISTAKFLGHLCAERVVPSKVVFAVIDDLLPKGTAEINESKLEVLMALLFVVGPTLDRKVETRSAHTHPFVQLIQELSSLLQKGGFANDHIRYVIDEWLELRSFNWNMSRPFGTEEEAIAFMEENSFKDQLFQCCERSFESPHRSPAERKRAFDFICQLFKHQALSDSVFVTYLDRLFEPLRGLLAMPVPLALTFASNICALFKDFPLFGTRSSREYFLSQECREVSMSYFTRVLLLTEHADLHPSVRSMLCDFVEHQNHQHHRHPEDLDVDERGGELEGAPGGNIVTRGYAGALPTFSPYAVVVLLGVPGVGKSWLGRRLHRNGEIFAFIDIGSQLVDRGTMAKAQRHNPAACRHTLRAAAEELITRALEAFWQSDGAKPLIMTCVKEPDDVYFLCELLQSRGREHGNRQSELHGWWLRDDKLVLNHQMALTKNRNRCQAEAEAEADEDLDDDKIEIKRVKKWMTYHGMIMELFASLNHLVEWTKQESRTFYRHGPSPSHSPWEVRRHIGPFSPTRLVVGKSDRNRVISVVCDAMGVEVLRHSFPSSHLCTEAQVRWLSRPGGYLVSRKGQGIRHFLAVSSKGAWLINRAGSVYDVTDMIGFFGEGSDAHRAMEESISSSSIEESVQVHTVLDGEVNEVSEAAVSFTAFDVLVFGGEKKWMLPLQDRLAALQGCCWFDMKDDGAAATSLILHVNEYCDVSSSNVRTMASDGGGLIFTPQSQYTFGKDQFKFTWSSKLARSTTNCYFLESPTSNKTSSGKKSRCDPASVLISGSGSSRMRGRSGSLLTSEGGSNRMSVRGNYLVLPLATDGPGTGQSTAESARRPCMDGMIPGFLYECTYVWRDDGTPAKTPLRIRFDKAEADDLHSFEMLSHSLLLQDFARHAKCRSTMLLLPSPSSDGNVMMTESAEHSGMEEEEEEGDGDRRRTTRATASMSARPHDDEVEEEESEVGRGEPFKCNQKAHPAHRADFDNLYLEVMQRVTSGSVERYINPDTGIEVFSYVARHCVGAYDAYTERDPVEDMCRGLILHPPSKAVLATPFVRFFSPTLLEINRRQEHEVHASVKFDGSLIVAFKWQGKIYASTRRRMSSEQAVCATSMLRRSPEATETFCEGWTYLLELIGGENTHISEYCISRSFVFLSAVDDQGLEVPHEDRVEIARRLKFMMPPLLRGKFIDIVDMVYGASIVDVTGSWEGSAAFALDAQSLNPVEAKERDIQSILSHPLMSSCEGLVVEDWVDGKRFKLVGDAWSRASVAVKELVRPAVVWRAMLMGRLPQLLRHPDLPSHARSEISSMADAVGRNFDAAIAGLACLLSEVPPGTRRQPSKWSVKPAKSDADEQEKEQEEENVMSLEFVDIRARDGVKVEGNAPPSSIGVHSPSDEANQGDETIEQGLKRLSSLEGTDRERAIHTAIVRACKEDNACTVVRLLSAADKFNVRVCAQEVVRRARPVHEWRFISSGGRGGGRVGHSGDGGDGDGCVRLLLFHSSRPSTSGSMVGYTPSPWLAQTFAKGWSVASGHAHDNHLSWHPSQTSSPLYALMSVVGNVVFSMFSVDVMGPSSLDGQRFASGRAEGDARGVLKKRSASSFAATSFELLYDECELPRLRMVCRAWNNNITAMFHGELPVWEQRVTQARQRAAAAQRAIMQFHSVRASYGHSFYGGSDGDNDDDRYDDHY